MKERPMCCIEGCDSPALCFMFDRYFCGDCVADWDRRNKEKMFKQMKEDLK